MQIASGLKRGISSCSDCPSQSLDASAIGAYLAPFFRVTFGRQGLIGLIARSQWFMAGDLTQMTVFGLEYGAP